jgi:hypothetical protein
VAIQVVIAPLQGAPLLGSLSAWPHLHGTNRRRELPLLEPEAAVQIQSQHGPLRRILRHLQHLFSGFEVMPELFRCGLKQEPGTCGVLRCPID